ncbi:MAG TPA: hypothetical protein VHO69_00860 [Phototrophicaceae bacterium]|nr:hypothetical protein [Phototrophicaceae bacterium]
MMQKFRNVLIGCFVLLVGGLLLIGAPVNAQTCGVSQPPQLVSVALDGTPGGVGELAETSISADGRYIAFTSPGNNLVAGDTNQARDVFLRDIIQDTTQRVSVGTNELQANDDSDKPSLSGNGNLVAFESHAFNLVAGDRTDDCTPSVDASWCADVFVYNRQTKAVNLVSAAWNSSLPAGNSHDPIISDDGRYVAFYSAVDNLVADDTNNTTDVFVRDLTTGTTERISISSTGAEGNKASLNPMGISWDGRYVTFESFASNLVENDNNIQCDYPRWGDFECQDVFIHDRLTHQTKRVSVASDGTEANGSSWNHSLSPDGQYVSFTSNATNLVAGTPDSDWRIYVHNLAAGTTQLASVGSGLTDASATYPSLSYYGRYLAFTGAGGLVFVVHDSWTGQNLLVSNGLDSQPVNGDSRYPMISVNGRYVAFWSFASNLIPGDTNNEGDIFVAALDCPADVSPEPTEEPTPEVTPTEEVTPQPTQPPNATPVRNYYQTSTLTLTWNRIPWAAQYRIQVDTDKAFQPEFIVNELVGADQLEKTLTGLNPNTYYWRVQALNANGKAGGWSMVESFVVGYE